MKNLELCGFTRNQVRRTIEKMLQENILKMEGKGRIFVNKFECVINAFDAFIGAIITL